MRVVGVLFITSLALPAFATDPPRLALKVVCTDSLAPERPLLFHLAQGYASIIDSSPQGPTCITEFPRTPPEVPPGATALLVIALASKEPAGTHPIVLAGDALLVATGGKHKRFSISVRRGEFPVRQAIGSPDPRYLLDGELGTVAWRFGLLDQERPRRAFPTYGNSALWGELLISPPRS